MTVQELIAEFSIPMDRAKACLGGVDEKGYSVRVWYTDAVGQPCHMETLRRFQFAQAVDLTHGFNNYAAAVRKLTTP